MKVISLEEEKRESRDCADESDSMMVDKLPQSFDVCGKFDATRQLRVRVTVDQSFVNKKGG